MLTYLIISTVLGGLIGWSTNVLAVKLIFRPHKPYKLLGLFTIQGLLPKRKKELAQIIGKTVEKELLSSEEIFSQLESTELKNRLSFEIIERIKLRIESIIPGFIPTPLKDHLNNLIDSVLQGEVINFLEGAFPKVSKEVADSFSIASVIEEKINKLNLVELERIILKISQKELKHIEYLGGIIGLIIGLTQGLVLLMLTSY